MGKIFKKDAGFTLIEILVYIGTLSIILSALSFFIVWSVHSANKAKAMREALYNTRRSIEIMTHEIREAKIISSSSTATHIYLENTTTTEFYLVASNLYQKTGSLEPVALTSNNVEVKNLEFKQVATATSTPSIQISLTINYKNPVNLPEYGASVNTTSTASLRSY